MNRLVVLILLPAIGCSSQPFVVESNCAVYNFEGQLTKGLITPSIEQKNQFLNQLEERDRDWDYCWYQTEDGEIELSVGNFGHFFVPDGESWKYDSERTYIIISHEKL